MGLALCFCGEMGLEWGKESLQPHVKARTGRGGVDRTQEQPQGKGILHRGGDLCNYSLEMCRDTQDSLRPFQRVYEVKTIFTILLICSISRASPVAHQ